MFALDVKKLVGKGYGLVLKEVQNITSLFKNKRYGQSIVIDKHGNLLELLIS